MTGLTQIQKIYEDERWLVIDKPQGLASVPPGKKGGHPDHVVAQALVLCPALGASPLKEHGLLNRLDTQTAGLMVFAKTEAEFHRLKENWNHAKKYYFAQVQGALSAPNGGFPWRISTPLCADPKSRKRVLPYDPTHYSLKRAKALDAQTVIESVVYDSSTNRSGVWIQIKTGVRHQIRVHLASLGHPIIGDEIYGTAEGGPLKLWAWKLSLPRPDQSLMSFESQLQPMELPQFKQR